MEHHFDCLRFLASSVKYKVWWLCCCKTKFKTRKAHNIVIVRKRGRKQQQQKKKTDLLFDQLLALMSAADRLGSATLTLNTVVSLPPVHITTAARAQHGCLATLASAAASAPAGSVNNGLQPEGMQERAAAARHSTNVG
ncbi:hypothetical protein AMECASPLE_037600 [Ameca splendens]|uniref:Uncharacterized protein n=1 Tax=Ameca splendens TaxID=208324 RepID=A0ABV0XL06_9TELE